MPPSLDSLDGQSDVVVDSSLVQPRQKARPKPNKFPRRRTAPTSAEAVDSMVKGVFQYLMGQEKQHRELLSNTLVFLEAPLEWFGREERHIFDQ